ncbi:MAG: hypothetical protein NXY59_06145 [Aigarchaeota archaeon]|nr:hypothetical protein [Candidatus Pelearchaeum maunauluense]
MRELKTVREVSEALKLHYGVDERWWPGESRLEIALGAILVQNTSWKNAALAIKALKERNLIAVESLLQIDARSLSRVIRPAGFPERKARTIKRFIRFLHEYCGGDTRSLARIKDARELLLAIEGVGEETADTILLFAADYPTFPASAYLVRVLARVGLAKRPYGAWRSLVMEALGNDAGALKIFHAAVVSHAKSTCLKEPRCGDCPIIDLCKYGRGKLRS